MQGFVPWDGGSPSRVETHGEVPRITEIFDNSGSSIILSIMGFLTRLKSKKVKIGEEKMSQMIIKGKLSEGCHEREWAQMNVSSREKNNIKRNLVRATTKSKSRMQIVSKGCVSRGERNQCV